MKNAALESWATWLRSYRAVRRGLPTVPAMNLLRPALPARRARVAAFLVVILVLVALIDVGLVLGWLGISLQNSRIQGQIDGLRSDEARWQAEAARYAGITQDRARLLRQLEVLNELPTGYSNVRALAEHLAAALPDGAVVQTANLGEDGFVLITGTAQTFDGVERYVRALEAGGMFRYVRVATAGRPEALAGNSPNAAGGGGLVTFQVEGWLEEAAGDDGGV